MDDRERVWADDMRAGLAGDEAAYRRVLASLAVFLRMQVRQVLNRYGQSAADLEDIVQETLLAIHLKRQSWRPAEPFVPWVRAVARNKTIDALRRKGRRVNVPIEDVIETLPAEPQAEHLSEHDAVQILSNLNGRQRDIVQSISIDGASIRETAQKYEISEGAVRVALHRGLQALAKIYRSTGHEN